MSTTLDALPRAYWRGMENRRSFVAVVDDEESVRRALIRLLRAANMDAEAFASGEAFLESLEKFRPDCVVLDVRMPRMDGVEAMGRMLARKKDLPVILNTAYSSYQDDFRSWPAEAYVIKSSDMSELKRAIRKALRPRQAV